MSGGRRLVRVGGLALCTLLALQSPSARSHGAGPLGAEVLDWRTEQISRVVTSVESFGDLVVVGERGRVVELGGRPCLRGAQFHFDVRERLAFDIDETVGVEVDFALGKRYRAVTVAYDRNGGGPGTVDLVLPDAAGQSFSTQRFTLKRARFAGRGPFGSDLTVAGVPLSRSIFAHAITLCDVRITRGAGAREPGGHGWLDLVVRDERGEPTPARLGLYDATERAPLPSGAALETEAFGLRRRMILLSREPGSAGWPSPNRWVFHTGGSYRARLPAGEYRLVVAKGLEYRRVTRSIRIEADGTRALEITLRRWTDLPARGWYSGDVHIHTARRGAADGWASYVHARAEDLHVANSLQMGNVSGVEFQQALWGEQGRIEWDAFSVVPGQEDPRTTVRGHAIHLDIPEPVRIPHRYLLYHEVTERVAELGGVSGYAHIGGVAGTAGGRVGLALDAPFGEVDFVEVLQGGGLGTEVWFDLLNLGYRIPPAAGSDAPFVGNVGDVRTYVKLPGEYSADAWFAGLAAGRTFVTTGPMVELDLNGAGVGSEVELAAGEPMRLSARATINPDIDLLERIELIEQGEVVAESSSAEGAEVLEIAFDSTARRGTWFVVRAAGRTTSPTRHFGSRTVEAISAPIYVSVDGQRTWRPDRVPAIVAEQKELLELVANLPVERIRPPEPWQTEPGWSSDWPRQRDLLRHRIERALAAYTELERLAETAGPGSGPRRGITPPP